MHAVTGSRPHRISGGGLDQRNCLREVTIRLHSEDLTSVRFALSPLWECVAAFRAWMAPSPHALLMPWIVRISTAVHDIDWTLLADLALVQRGTIPDFLCPPPTTPMPRLSDELDSLRRIPEDVIRAEIEIAYANGAPRSLQQALENPSTFINRLTVLLEEFWRRAVAPDWGLLRAKLEAEMLFRARALALGGFHGLFSGLHKDVSFHQNDLVVKTLSHWNGRERKRGLLLIPSIFSWPDVFLTVRPPWRPAIIYPARGLADLWDDASPSSTGGLNRLVGDSCATIIALLQVPRTTLEAAATLKLSPAATSEQITKLWRVGILERTRIGRRVFYVLNEKGKTLFTTFRA
jgi:hypothetical protein